MLTAALRTDGRGFGFMSDALLVLNAGSSSLKFSAFRDEESPRELLRGQIDGLPDRPRFIARSGTLVVGQHEWADGERLDHQGAISFLFAWGRSGSLERHHLIGVGHRVVHGGITFAEPVLLDERVVAALEK